MTRRYYVAVKPPSWVKEAVHEYTRHLDQSSLRFTDHYEYHVTLKYLGEQPNEVLLEIIKRLEAAKIERGQAEVTLQVPETFRSESSNRSLWLPVSGLQAIAAGSRPLVESVVDVPKDPAGMENWTGHMTVAYGDLGDTEELVAHPAHGTAIRWRVEAIYLIVSGRNRPRGRQAAKVLARIPLVASSDAKETP